MGNHSPRQTIIGWKHKQYKKYVQKGHSKSKKQPVANSDWKTMSWSTQDLSNATSSLNCSNERARLSEGWA